MKLFTRYLSIALIGAFGLTLVGCNAGTADIPASVPHPRKMSDAPGAPAGGQSLADVAKAKGMSREEKPGGAPSRSFNPTNPSGQ